VKLFKLSTKMVVTVGIGAALYGVLGLVGIPIGPNVELKPAMLVLALFSIMFGPVIGFLVGAIGHFLTDLLAGWGLWWDWELSSGIIGFFIGLITLFKGFNFKYGKFRYYHMIIYTILAGGGSVVAYLFAGYMDVLLMGEAPTKILVQVVLITTTNVIIMVGFGVPIIVGIMKANNKHTNLVIEEDDEEEAEA